MVKKVSGQINSEANEEILDDILTRTFDNERVKEIMAPRLAAIGSSTTGILDPDMAFAWQQDSKNVNMLNLMAYAEGDYSRMVQVGTVNLQTLTSTSSVAFANELAEELNKAVEQADTAELMSIEAQKLAEASGITIAPAPTGYISDPVSRAYDALNQSMDMSSFTPPSVITPAGASTLDMDFSSKIELPKSVPQERANTFANRVLQLEGPAMFKAERLRIGTNKDGTPKYEKDATAGHGHSGPDVIEGKIYSQEQVDAWFVKDMNDKIKTTLRLFPKFSSYSPKLQAELIQTVFRGGIKKGHDTTKLINSGKFFEASDEFLRHDEYEKAKAGDPEASNKRGIVSRMDALAEALRLEMPLPKSKPKTKKDSGVPEDLDSFAFGQTFP